jgi:hypothetical protein
MLRQRERESTARIRGIPDQVISSPLDRSGGPFVAAAAPAPSGGEPDLPRRPLAR